MKGVLEFQQGLHFSINKQFWSTSFMPGSVLGPQAVVENRQTGPCTHKVPEGDRHQPHSQTSESVIRHRATMGRAALPIQGAGSRTQNALFSVLDQKDNEERDQQFSA